MTRLKPAVWPLLLAGAGAWAVVRYDFSRAAAAMAGADWPLAALAFCLNIGLLYFRVFKWHLILAPVPGREADQTPPGDRHRFYLLCLAAFSGYLCNAVLPARVGGLVQAWIAGRRAGIGFFPAIGSIALIRVLDLAALVTLGGLVLGAAALFAPGLEAVPGMGLKIAGAALLVMVPAALLWYLVKPRGPAPFLTRTALKMLPPKYRDRGRGAAEGFIRGLAVLGQPGRLAVVAGLSILFWLTAGTSVRLMLLALDLGPDGFTAAFILLLAQVLALGVPAPANAGPFHGATVAVLSVYGVPVETGILAAVAMHLVMVLSNALPGVVYTGIDGTRIPDLYKNLYREMKKDMDR